MTRPSRELLVVRPRAIATKVNDRVISGDSNGRVLEAWIQLGGHQCEIGFDSRACGFREMTHSIMLFARSYGLWVLGLTLPASRF